MAFMVELGEKRAAFQGELGDGVMAGPQEWAEAFGSLVTGGREGTVVGFPGSEGIAPLRMAIITAGTGINEQGFIAIPKGEVEGITVTVGGEGTKPKGGGIQAGFPAILMENDDAAGWE
jgi:hypothetical protein